MAGLHTQSKTDQESAIPSTPGISGVANTNSRNKASFGSLIPSYWECQVFDGSHCAEENTGDWNLDTSVLPRGGSTAGHCILVESICKSAGW